MKKIILPINTSILCAIKEEEYRLLSFFEEAGYLWNSGSKPTKLTYWKKEKYNTYYIYHDNSLRCGHGIENNTRKIITFKEFMGMNKHRSLRL